MSSDFYKYLISFNCTNYTFCETTTQNVAYGTEITLANYEKSITNGTYHHAALAENGTSVTSTTLTTNTTIYLYYSRNTYTLTLNRGTNIASVTGAGTYKVGKSVIIDATLATSPTGYTISWSRWTSDNTSLIPNNSTRNATITMPAGNVTLTANATNTINKYTVTCIDKVGNASGATLGTSTWTENYGTTVSGSSATKTYSGYTYSSCTSATVTTSGATVYRYFTKAGAGTLIGVWSRTSTTTEGSVLPIAGLSRGDVINFTISCSGTGHLNVFDNAALTGSPLYSSSTSETRSITVPNISEIFFEIFIANEPYVGASGSINLTINSITNSAGLPYTLVSR